MTHRTMTVREIVEGWVPGSSDWGWDEEVEDLYSSGHRLSGAISDNEIRWADTDGKYDPEAPARNYQEDLTAHVEEHGVGFKDDDEFNMITLGPDGRVWDGHHRICAAIHLDLLDDEVVVDVV